MAKKSDDLAQLQGNPGKRKPTPQRASTIARNKRKEAARQEIVAGTVDSVRAAALDAPDFLSPAAKRIWPKVQRAISSLGLIRASDSFALGRYCNWLANYAELLKKTSGRKMIHETKTKHVAMKQAIDKAFVLLMDVDKQLLMYEDRFGMSPRERLSILKVLAGAAGEHRGGQHSPPPGPETPAEGGEPARPPAVPSSPIGILGSTKH